MIKTDKAFTARQTPVKFVARFERQLAKIVKNIRNIYEREVLKKLSEGAKTQLRDAADDGWSNELAKNFKKAELTVMALYSDKELEKSVKQIVKQLTLGSWNASKGSLKLVGLTNKQVINNGIENLENAKIQEITSYLKQMRNQTLTGYYENTLREAAAGGNITEILKSIQTNAPKQTNKAHLIARNELKNFNNAVHGRRAENLGITEAKWTTVGDARTRECHKARNGQIYKIKDGLYSKCDRKTLRAGFEINCRCHEDFIIPRDWEAEND